MFGRHGLCQSAMRYLCTNMSPSPAVRRHCQLNINLPQRPSLSVIIQRLLTQPARVSTGWGKQCQAVDWTLAMVMHAGILYAQVGRPITDLSTDGPTLKYRYISDNAIMSYLGGGLRCLSASSLCHEFCSQTHVAE